MPAKTTVTRDQIEDVTEAAGLFEHTVRFDYSGRGMYGDTCFGIVGSISDLVNFVALAAVEIPGSEDWLHNVLMDSTGLSQIYYWPNVEVTDD